VPLSNILINNFCQFCGVPVGAPKVAQTDNAVNSYWSVVSALGVGATAAVVDSTLLKIGEPFSFPTATTSRVALAEL